MLGERRGLKFILVKREALDQHGGHISVPEPHDRAGVSCRLWLRHGGGEVRVHSETTIHKGINIVIALVCIVYCFCPHLISKEVGMCVRMYSGDTVSDPASRGDSTAIQ